MNIKTQWVDVRNFIKTNSNYRDAEVNWDLTQKNISKHKRKNFKRNPRVLGSNENNFTTTLGREGSDHSCHLCLLFECRKCNHLKDVPE
jgi:aspartate kinase